MSCDLSIGASGRSSTFSCVLIFSLACGMQSDKESDESDSDDSGAEESGMYSLPELS